MATLDEIRDFFSLKRIAVVGVSRNIFWWPSKIETLRSDILTGGGSLWPRSSRSGTS